MRFSWFQAPKAPAATPQPPAAYSAAVSDLAQRVSALEHARHAERAEITATIDTLNRMMKRQVERERAALLREAAVEEEPGEPRETAYEMRRRLGR